MTTIKNAVLAVALAAVAAVHADTPIVQALKVEQGMKDVMEALHEVNAEAETFAQAPDAIRGLTRIGDLLAGLYDGPITIKSTDLPHAQYLLQEVPGRFDIYAPNLVSLPESAFSEAIGIETFYAPKVTSIGPNSFDMTSHATKLKNAVFPACTSIGSTAFEDCANLTNAEFNVTSLGDTYIFNKCYSLESLKTRPLTSIGQYALSNCQKLKHLNLNLESCSFGQYACNNCYSLEITNWPASITISDFAFQNCRSFKSINELLSRWTNIGTVGMFYGCSGLTELQSDNLVSINNTQVFQYCSSVTNISFPNMTVIGATYQATRAFANMASLKNVDLPKLVAIQAGSFDPSQYVFAYNTALEEIELPSLEQVGTAPNSWSAQPPYLFEGCTKLRRVSFPKCRQFFSRAGFRNCNVLKQVEMPAVKQLGRDSEGYEHENFGTFAFCTSLEELSLPELETLNQQRWTFKQCLSLKKFSAPKLINIYASSTTKSINEMFYQCPSIRDVTFGLTSPQLLAYTGLASCSPNNNNVVFHCPADAPFNVDVMYLNGKWTAVTNGTFKLCESISGTGTQYINTGYIHKTNTVVEIDFALMPRSSTTRSYEALFGSRNNNDTSRSFQLFSRFASTDRFAYCRNQVQQGPVLDTSVETRYRAVCATNSCQVFNTSGELLYSMTTTASFDTGVGPLIVFSRNDSTAAGGTSVPSVLTVQNMKLYRFTLKEEGDIVMDLLPGIVGNGESEAPCLLDAADNWHPLFNSGTGNFEAGAVTNSIPTAVGN